MSLDKKSLQIQAKSRDFILNPVKYDGNEVCSACLAEEPPGEQDIDWIGCDSCAGLFHVICVGLCNENVPDQWQCSSCVESWEGVMGGAKSKEKQPTKQLVTTQPQEVCSACLAEEPPGEQDIDWIGCDSCAGLFHVICVGLCNENVPDQWQCSSCVESWEGVMGGAKSKEKQPTKQLVTTQPQEVCSACLAEEPPGEQDIDWIGCDSCAGWFHVICVGPCNKKVPNQWQCSSCVESWEQGF